MKIGIYKIQNTLNNICYIGSSNNIPRRRTEHIGKLRRNQHKNSYLQNAWNKYGEANFIFETIEECKEEELLIREQVYLDNIAELYNSTRIAGGRFRAGYKMTDVQKEFLAKLRTGFIMTDDTKEKLRKINTGKKHSKETKNKVKEISRSNWEKPEYRENLSKKRREMWASEGYKDKVKISMVEAQNKLETKEKVVAGMKKWREENPDAEQNRINKLIINNKDLEIRRIKGENISNWRKNNPEKIKEINKNMKKTYFVTNVENGEQFKCLGAKELFEKLNITRMMFDYSIKKKKLILGKYDIKKERANEISQAPSDKQ